MLTINLPEDIAERLQSLSLHTGRTVQYYAREAILEHLDDIENRFLALHQSRDGIAEELSEKLDEMIDF